MATMLRVARKARGKLLPIPRRHFRRKRTFSTYRIHPAIGVARLGNSKAPDAWFLAPTTIGGVPTEFEEHTESGQKDVPVEKYKTPDGKVRRQAAKFTVYKDDQELTFDDDSIESVKWTVWVANKKSVWWNFSELCGDLMLGPDNSYEAWADKTKPGHDGKPTPITSLRNENVKRAEERQKYIVNPGPRTVSSDGRQFARFDRDPNVYPQATFPSDALQGKAIAGPPIESLGDMNMSFTTGDSVSLFVRGGYGYACGDDASTFGGFAGADGWFDDTSDGPVECEIKLKGQDEPIRLKAYVVCGTPKFAAEITNLTTWDDVIFDMAVRYRDFGQQIGMVDGDKKFILGQSGYKPNIEQDILPLFQRMRDYQWVANIAAMTQFASPPFPIDNPTPSEEEIAARLMWFSLLREAVDFSRNVDQETIVYDEHQQLFSRGNATDNIDTESYPAMPVGAGSGSVNGTSASGRMSKFITFTPTQFYMLSQWAHGITAGAESFGLNPLDRASVGNCVGYPNSPGIEITWTSRNPHIYEQGDFYRLKSVDIETLKEKGLSLGRDETAPTEEGGCEPGDMSKRMAIPWLADFAYCSVQPINFTDPLINQGGGDSSFPQYFTYWWPAQSPYNVYIGNMTKEEQVLEAAGSDSAYAGVSGQNVMYQRGLADIQDANELVRTMIDYWSDLGFLVNTNKDSETGKDYPYFVEKERNFKSWVKLHEQKKIQKRKDLLEIAKQAEKLENLETTYVNI